MFSLMVFDRTGLLYLIFTKDPSSCTSETLPTSIVIDDDDDGDGDGDGGAGAGAGAGAGGSVRYDSIDPNDSGCWCGETDGAAVAVVRRDTKLSICTASRGTAGSVRRARCDRTLWGTISTIWSKFVINR